MQIEKSIAYQVLANGNIGGEVAMHCMACFCIISTGQGHMLQGLGGSCGLWCKT